MICSCKAEKKKTIEEKKNNIVLEDSITNNLNRSQEYGVWHFYDISDYPVIDLEGIEREKLKKEIEKYTIKLNENHITISNFCSYIEYVNLREKSLSYFTNQDNLERYSNALSNKGIKFSDSINIIRSTLPDDECDYPFGEIIKINDLLIVLYEGYLVFFSKEVPSDNFISEYNKLSNISLPTNYDLIDSIEDSKFIPIPDKYKYFLGLEYLSNYKGLKLPIVNKDIKPILISAYQESGEQNLYIYNLSEESKVLDKLVLFSIEGETEQGNNIGNNTFNIDKNYKIKITRTLENDKKIIKYYRINKNGKFEEINNK